MIKTSHANEYSYSSNEISRPDTVKPSNDCHVLIAEALSAPSRLRASHASALSDLKIAIDPSIEHSSAQIADALASEVIQSIIFVQDHISLAGRLTESPGDLVVMIKQITECASTSSVLIPLIITSGQCQCYRLA